MSDVFRELFQNGQLRPMRYKDRHTGLVHSCEGADVHEGIRLLWTRCGQRDVPANTAWAGYDEVTCKGCLIKESEFNLAPKAKPS